MGKWLLLATSPAAFSKKARAEMKTARAENKKADAEMKSDATEI
jgi:hypothetical protein